MIPAMPEQIYWSVISIFSAGGVLERSFTDRSNLDYSLCIYFQLKNMVSRTARTKGRW